MIMKSWCHNLHSSRDIKQNVLKLLTLGHFLPFYPLKNLKIIILKNIKIFCDIIIYIINMCVFPEIQGDTDRIFCHFGRFFALLPKIPKNYDQMMYSSWDMVRDRQMDGQKKWHIEVGAPPKNSRHKL